MSIQHHQKEVKRLMHDALDVHDIVAFKDILNELIPAIKKFETSFVQENANKQMADQVAANNAVAPTVENAVEMPPVQEEVVAEPVVNVLPEEPVVDAEVETSQEHNSQEVDATEQATTQDTSSESANQDSTTVADSSGTDTGSSAE